MLKDLKLHPDGMVEGPDGCCWESRADYMFIGVLPSCDCGDPASIGRYVRDMLRKHVADSGDHTTSRWETVDYADLPVMFFLSWANREKYIEHGTTIRCSWLTEKGEELLRDLDIVLAEIEKDEHE